MADVTTPEPPDLPDPDDFTNTSPYPTNDIDLAILCDELQDRRVTQVVIRYSGSGDSGGVEEVEFLPPEVQVPDWLKQHLSELAEDYCPDGYENNEGGYGTLTICPLLGLAQLEHGNFYEASEDMDTSGADLPKQLRKRLSTLGVIRVTAHFDGYGDSGQFESFTVEPETVILPREVEDELDGFLLDELPEGWENNGGGFGDFAIDVASGEVTANAYWRVEQSTDPEVTRWKWRP